MDESEFRNTHTQVNDRPCPFGKAMLTRCCNCSRARKVLLAERETIYCVSPGARERCQEALVMLREKARFALRMTHLEGPLPHGKEIRVQCGGALGLQAVVGGEAGPVEDFHWLMESVLARYGAIADLPYSEIMKSIVSYQLRRRGPSQ